MVEQHHATIPSQLTKFFQMTLAARLLGLVSLLWDRRDDVMGCLIYFQHQATPWPPLCGRFRRRL